MLGEFWAELREKSRVRIEHPDLPADLRDAAGELVATLWTRATASAQAELDALRVEVEGQRTEAEHRVAATLGELERTEVALEQRTAALLAAQVEIRELEKAQVEGRAARQALEADLARLKNEVAERDRDLEAVREGFSHDLEKLRETAGRAEERLRATEKRTLLEIDRERGAVAKLQKEFDLSTKRAESREVDQRHAVETLQTQLGDARHKAGVLQGRLDTVHATNVTLQQQLEALREDTRSPRAKTAGKPARPVMARQSRAARASGTSSPTRQASATMHKPPVRRKQGPA